MLGLKGPGQSITPPAGQTLCVYVFGGLYVCVCVFY